MTLILAVECAEGLLLASDSQGTFNTSGQPVRGQSQKLHAPWTNVAWGGAGSVGIIQQLDQDWQREFAQRTRFDKKASNEVRDELARSAARILKPLYTERLINVPGQPPPGATFLVTGYCTDGPFIMEIGQNLLSEHHKQTGFAAIGSGDIFPYFALASVAHFNIRSRSLAEARLVVYRVMEDAINVAAFGLGMPIQMIEIAKPKAPGQCGVAYQLSESDLLFLQHRVAEWKAVESDSLTQFIGITTGGE